METKLTVAVLEEQGGIYEAINYAKSQYPEYPDRPTKPILPSKHTSDDVVKYAETLAIYENQMVKYDGEKKTYQKKVNEIDAILEEFIKDQAGLNTIPEQYRANVWSKAWSDGHSGGYGDVYNELSNLIDIFK